MRAPRTLSALWARADKELIHIKLNFGWRETKQACALGAIEYYLGDQSISDLSEASTTKVEELIAKANQAIREDFPEVKGVADMNDNHKWKFKDFAKWARRRKI